MEQCENILAESGIRPTANRLLVLRVLYHARHAMSLSDVEDQLQSVDKSTVFRILTLFSKHHLIHTVDDGSGQMKYALCGSGCHCHAAVHGELADVHMHFYCIKCRHTYCLRKLPVPQVPLPMGFVLQTANFVLKGICPRCSKK